MAPLGWKVKRKDDRDACFFEAWGCGDTPTHLHFIECLDFLSDPPRPSPIRSLFRMIELPRPVRILPPLAPSGVLSRRSVIFQARTRPIVPILVRSFSTVAARHHQNGRQDCRSGICSPPSTPRKSRTQATSGASVPRLHR